MALNIWRFHVKEGCIDEFVSMNTEDWPQLFAQSEAYQKTELTGNMDDPLVYLVMDSWTSRDAFEDFKEKNKTAFDKLDRKHAELYDSVEHIGFYD